MTVEVKGNYIRVFVPAKEITSPTRRATAILPDGYSYERIHIIYLSNIAEIMPYFLVTLDSVFRIPPVRSHSPSTFTVLVRDVTADAEIRIVIEKFGQIPDAHYFDRKFEPILVTGDDGEKHNVIPSDQFK